MEPDLNSRTPAGLLAYCDYLMSKGYATAAQVNPWRTAVQKMFETVEGDSWMSLDLTSIDLDEYVARFRTLAGAQYKAESLTAYARRIRNALDAHEHYLATGRPPSFRQKTAAKAKGDNGSGSVIEMESRTAPTTPANASAPTGGLVEFPYVLGDGRMVTMKFPPRMKSDDVNRLCAFIRTLQDDSPEPRQIPRTTGEDNGEEPMAA